MKIYLNYGWSCALRPKYWLFKFFKFQNANGSKGRCLWFGPLNISI